MTNIRAVRFLPIHLAFAYEIDHDGIDSRSIDIRPAGTTGCSFRRHSRGPKTNNILFQCLISAGSTHSSGFAHVRADLWNIVLFSVVAGDFRWSLVDQVVADQVVASRCVARKCRRPIIRDLSREPKTFHTHIHAMMSGVSY